MRITKTSRENRFNPDKITHRRQPYDNFSFGKSLKSFKDETLLFTNFVNTKQNENYCRLENMVINTLYEDYNFLEQDFDDLDEIKYTYKTADRLLDIINKGYHHKYKIDDLKHIFKMKYSDNPKFQLYLYKSRNNLTVVLIDFFHLAIPADKQISGSTIKLDLSKLYYKQSKNSWDIANIISIQED